MGFGFEFRPPYHTKKTVGMTARDHRSNQRALALGWHQERGCPPRLGACFELPMHEGLQNKHITVKPVTPMLWIILNSKAPKVAPP